MTSNEDTTRLVEELVEVGRSTVATGLALASGGNLSARLPDHDAFVVTRSGAWLDKLVPGDFTIMSLAGDVLDGNPSPSSEWKLHQRAYGVRPDVNSVVHVHPQHALLVDALGHKVRLMTLDHAYYVTSIGTTPFYPNGSDILADSVAEQALHHNCVIMSHHGCTAVGETIEMAFRRALNLEEAATATYRALVVGNTTAVFPPDDFAALHHA